MWKTSFAEKFTEQLIIQWMWAKLKSRLATFLKRSEFSGKFDQLVDRASEEGFLVPLGYLPRVPLL